MDYLHLSTLLIMLGNNLSLCWCSKTNQHFNVETYHKYIFIDNWTLLTEYIFRCNYISYFMINDYRKTIDDNDVLNYLIHNSIETKWYLVFYSRISKLLHQDNLQCWHQLRNPTIPRVYDYNWFIYMSVMYILKIKM